MIAPLKQLFGGLKPPGLVERLSLAKEWIVTNTMPGAGVCISSIKRTPYPEVSGYLIPSLLSWGECRLAEQYGHWLSRIQNADGSWSDPGGTAPYTFDTGQILKGLLALVDRHPGLEPAIRRGCDWLVTQVRADGRVTTPDTSQWGLPGGRMVPEAIHLYALKPLGDAAKRWGVAGYADAVGRAVHHYSQSDVGDFSTLSHFHAYIVEAFLDLGRHAEAAAAMAEIAALQRGDGAVPAYRGERWICSTGLFQYALIWYRLNEKPRADRAFARACALQNCSGGFYGGYGRGSTYFPREEISWAVKYFLDAFWWKIRSGFDADAAMFPEEIAREDGRYRLVAETLQDLGAARVLDAGCGRGRYLRRLATEFPDACLVGLDLSECMLAALPDGIGSLSGSLLSIPEEDHRFDLVYCVEALEHAVDVHAAMRELLRVLKPGGTLLIIDKNHERLGRLRLAEWEQWFDADEVAGLLRELGAAVRVVRDLPYADRDGRDGLFLAWVAVKQLTC